MFGMNRKKTPQNPEQEITRLKEALNAAEVVIIGAGAGLSTAAGFTYTGPRFQKYFADFIQKYHFQDAYTGGFHNFSSLEEHWAYWSRYIYINRYMQTPKPVYQRLLDLVKEKDYFVLTTNVDHCFQKAGFDKQRLFYTQGDYGLWQCSDPCHDSTYDNEETVKQMVLAQGFTIDDEGNLIPPADGALKMTVPESLVPTCPVCGKPMTMNLRADNTFVEDAGWHRASEKYSLFTQRHRDMKVLFLELGTGWNTPGIIKYNFWRMTYQWPDATYACINLDDAYVPKEIEEKSIALEGDAWDLINRLQ